MMFMGLMWLLVLVWAIRWMVAPDAGRVLPEQTRRMAGELERLRDEVDVLSGQVERLRDEQSFLLRLLSEGERRPGLGAGPRPEGGEVPADGAAPREPRSTS